MLYPWTRPAPNPVHSSVYLSDIHHHISDAALVADVVLAGVVDCGSNWDAEEMDPT